MWGGGEVAAPSALDETDGGHCHVAIVLAVSDVQPQPSMMTEIS
jgi:hypothetical protein